MKHKTKDLLGPMRLPFIVLAPACVVLGLGTAVWTTSRINPFYFTLVLIGAVCAHVSVNAFNELFDFKSGLDVRTERTPFSGGSGVLPANPSLARSALIIAVGSMVLTALIGLFFLFVRGIGLLPLGVLGLFVILAYTPWLVHRPLLCLFAPGLGFGPLMVMGTHFVLTGEYSWVSFWASLIPFFLVNDLLLLNQFPDVEADRGIGRRHLPIVLGRRSSSLVYGAFLLLTYLVILVSALLGGLPKASLIGLLTALIAAPVAVNAYRHADDVPKLIPFMGLNVILNLVTPVLVAVGLFIG